jgi:tetratricopeptide (TPR) repeat protein
LLSFISLITLTAVAIRLRHQIPFVGVALLWFGITLLPVLNFFATNPVVADRYAFLPSFAVASLLAALLTRLGKGHPKSLAVLVIVVSVILGLITYSRTLDWRSDTSLWKSNIMTEPANAKGYQNLVAEALIAGDIPMAQKILAEGRLQAPSPTYDYLEGTMYYLRHDLTMALKAFEKAVQQDSDHIRSLFNIGVLYQEMGNHAKAAEYYRRTLEANAPDGWGCREQARKRLDSMADITGSGR